jgi:Na+/H+-dicarboxylate symporter
MRIRFGAAIEALHPRSLRYLNGQLQALVRGKLWLKVLIGMVVGLATGVLIGPSVGWVPPDIAVPLSSWLALPGQLFLALIQMIVIPLIVASIIRGLAASDNVDQLKTVGVRVMAYFVVTTSIAISIGLFVATTVKPGTYVNPKLVRQALEAPAPALDAMPDTKISWGELPQKMLTLLPSNPLSSMVENDMLRVVVFAIIVGVALVTAAPKQAKPLLDLLGSIQEISLTVVRWAMVLAPFAVFGLMAQLAAKIGLDILVGMAVYVGTVLVGLLLLLMVYLLIVAVVSRRRPLVFLRSIRDVLLLAFSTSSSAAVMPLSIRTAEVKLGVRPSISQFIVPLGATINMDGTALYQGVAAVFLAQVFGIDVGIGGMLLIIVTAVGASIGTPATPGVGIIILATVLTTVGIPPAGIALIIGVDRVLDMSRTTLNVCGDLVACSVMDRWVGGPLPKREEMVAQARLERMRERTGEDVLIAPADGSPA